MKLDITLSTKQSLAPNMIQLLELTRMTSQELEGYLVSQALENPAIDMDVLASAPFSSHSHESFEWLNSFQPGYKDLSKDRDAEEDADGLFSDELHMAAPELKDFLFLQLSSFSLSPEQNKICRYLVNSVDSYGYLDESPALIAEHLGLSQTLVEDCLSMVRDLSPAGVCAPDLKSCLLKQLAQEDADNPLLPLAAVIVKDFLQELAQGRFSSMAKRLRASVPDVRAAGRLIAGLQPYPSAGFGNGTPTVYIRPDVSISVEDGQIQVCMLSNFTPYLRINKYYMELYQTTSDPETREYLTGKIKGAGRLFENISMREKNIVNCMEKIAEKQKAFFSDPQAALVPMSLADIAEELDISLSTVSRIISGKYSQCCRGLLPAKALFTRKITSVGETAADSSSDEVKKAIKELLRSEDKARPYSDAQLASVCERKGFSVSRRTVAKYRTEMGIPAASARKK